MGSVRDDGTENRAQKELTALELSRADRAKPAAQNGRIAEQASAFGHCEMAGYAINLTVCFG